MPRVKNQGKFDQQKNLEERCQNLENQVKQLQMQCRQLQQICRYHLYAQGYTLY